MAYGARLESVLGASPRGFESPILRTVSFARYYSGRFCVKACWVQVARFAGVRIPHSPQIHIRPSAQFPVSEGREALGTADVSLRSTDAVAMPVAATGIPWAILV